MNIRRNKTIRVEEMTWDTDIEGDFFTISDYIKRRKFAVPIEESTSMSFDRENAKELLDRLTSFLANEQQVTDE